MSRILSFSFLMVFVVCFGAGALTVSGDSENGRLETIQPRLNSVTALRPSLLEVSFSEPMLEPGVKTPVNYTVSGPGAGTLTMHPTAVTGSEPYALTWTHGEISTATGTVTATGLQDAAGNPIDLAHNSASWTGGAPLPLYAWPLAPALLGAGLFVLARRRNRAGTVLLLVLAAVIAAPEAFAQMTVTNVTFAQGPNAGGTQVDISYDLGGSSPCAIGMLLSKDGGATFPNTLPLAHLSGDVGEGVTPGKGKHIAWDIVADCPNEDILHARIRVTADDGGGVVKTILLPDGVPLEMVRIPAGSFMMGRYSGEQDSSPYEDAQHQVTLTQGFWLGKYELTKRQWKAVMGTTPWSGQSYVLDDPNSPAVYINWNDCQSFVTAVNALGQGAFRLPTEAEWEYACRVGNHLPPTRFYWGDDSSYSQIGNYAWYRGNCSVEQYAHIVGQKLPNAWGVYDMSGNVWEWCQDWWAGNYPISDVSNPRGAGTGAYRVLRGGCWVVDYWDCRSACRLWTYPDSRYVGVGVRLCAAGLPR